MNDTHYKVGWDEFHKRCASLCDKIHLSGRTFTKILSVTRGGAVPAGIIAYQLGIKHIETISLETYGGAGEREVGEVKLLKAPRVDYLADTLVIDDLVDTGTTFAYLKPRTKNCLFVSVYAKPKGAPFTDLYDMNIAQDNWVVFPWDEKPKE